MKKKSAFTLVEMIIVIALIALMAGVAISNFGSARQQATLDLATDLVVSTIKQRQQLAKSGRTTFSDSSQGHGSSVMCYGLVFYPSTSQGEKAVELLEAPYKALDPTLNQADFCDFSTITSRPLPQFDHFTIRQITVDDNEVTEPLSIFFKPPFSKPMLRLSEQSVQTETPVIVVSIASPNRDEEKKVQFDSASGVTQRL